ncbi:MULTISPECIES: DUF2512 family protein [Bacillaceae]|uniref:DUF2512 domain-containing protein n=1 Tax=Pseudobacillus wudalianchiensis TaxID=1743143 RepID=A0A1B9AG63_9BACI|nr:MULTISPECIES: DUF2512 family protein [Bacillus]OCA82832.1 hypothetical protein A8F95_13935 [Bacillus wudalianchiensis]
MSRHHLTAVLIKFVALTAILYIALGVIMDTPVTDILIMGVVLTAVSYILGDLMVLPAAGNSLAVLGDIVLATLLLWIMGNVMDNSAGALVNALAVAFFLGVGEWFFHNYMQEKVLETRYKDPEHV